ncbi:MAG: JAB domain-containing protein [Aureispira sp.]
MDIPLSEEEKIKILNSKDLYGIMKKILLREQKIDQDREHFWVVGLDNANRILFIEMISMGTVNQALVKPMEVFSLALQRRAVNIILCHNHPSGELKPSADDRDVTDRLIQVGIIVDLPVYDHLLISLQSFLSFEDIGLMEELGKSLKYVPPYQQAERIREQALGIVLKEKKRLARQLKRKGVDLATIAETFGLSLEEVELL